MSRGISVQYLGHSCFLLTTPKAKILIDPFLTGNPKAATTADKVPADLILVSHGHGDHYGDAVAIAKRTGASIVAPYELALHAGGQGAKVHHYRWDRLESDRPRRAPAWAGCHVPA